MHIKVKQFSLRNIVFFNSFNCNAFAVMLGRNTSYQH